MHSFIYSISSLVKQHKYITLMAIIAPALS